MPELTKVALYARYSSDNQKDESIDAQVRAIEDYTKRHNMLIIEQYIDRAKSGTSDARPQFLKMIDDSKMQKFKYVIVHKMDRFSREQYEAPYYKMMLKRNGVRVLSVCENIDDSPEGIMMEKIIEGMNAYYSRNLARETMKGLKENAYKCQHNGGRPPLGYDVDKNTKNYVINQREAEAVKLIFDLYITNMGYDHIVKTLNSKGYKTKLGKPFGKPSLYDILSNEKYTGTYVFNKESKKDFLGKRNKRKHKPDEEIIRIPGGMPDIISPEDFKKAQKLMSLRKKHNGAHKAKRIYLLSGLIKCGECGGSYAGNSRWTGANKVIYGSYSCSTRKNLKQCSNSEISQDAIEEFILRELENQLINEKKVDYLVSRINQYHEEKSANVDNAVNRISAEIRLIDKEIDNVVDAIVNGFTSSALKVKLDNLEQTKSTLVSEKERAIVEASYKKITKQQVKDAINVCGEFVRTRNIPECKKFINFYVKQVFVYKNKIRVIFKFDPDHTVDTVGGEREIRTLGDD